MVATVATTESQRRPVLPLNTGTLSSTLVVEEVSKRYGQQVVLNNISFDVAPGTLTSLLGPNGAGKTTLLETLVGLRRCDTGQGRIFGKPFLELSAIERREIGIVLQHQKLPQLLQVGEYLDMIRAAYDVAEPRLELLEAFALDQSMTKRIGNLSGGQQRKLALVAALTGRPSLLILDEPTANLDPFSRLAFWRILRELTDRAERPSAILMATHDMFEATQLSTDVVILEEGRICAAGTPEALITQHCPAPQMLVPVSDAEQVSQILAQQDFEQRITFETEEAAGPRLVFEAGDLQSVLESPLAGFLDVLQLKQRSGTLEDVFVALLGPNSKKDTK